MDAGAGSRRDSITQTAVGSTTNKSITIHASWCRPGKGGHRLPTPRRRWFYHPPSNVRPLPHLVNLAVLGLGFSRGSSLRAPLRALHKGLHLGRASACQALRQKVCWGL